MFPLKDLGESFSCLSWLLMAVAAIANCLAYRFLAPYHEASVHCSYLHMTFLLGHQSLDLGPNPYLN
jgi:hypothetical protein